MKKVVLACSLFALALFGTNVSKAQVYEKGNVTVYAGYGFPNLYGTFVKALVEDDIFNTNVSVKSLGPIAGRAEYLLSEKIGIGLEFTYSSTTAKYTYFDSFDNMSYDYKLMTNRIRVLPRVNIHLGNDDKVDPYLAFGAGYGSRTFKYESNDQTIDELDFKSLIPVATRFAFGLKYYITDNIGLGAEIGLGGPLADAGVAFKF